MTALPAHLTEHQPGRKPHGVPWGLASNLAELLGEGQAFVEADSAGIDEVAIWHARANLALAQLELLLDQPAMTDECLAEMSRDIERLALLNAIRDEQRARRASMDLSDPRVGELLDDANWLLGEVERLRNLLEQ